MSEPKSHQDVFAEIQEAMTELDGEQVADIYNQICDKNIEYEGDGIWIHVDRIGVLHVDSDDDFYIVDNGSNYFGKLFSINVKSVEHLKSLTPTVDWDTSEENPIKDWEFKAGIEEVLKNPTEPFCNTGGNRGIQWIPEPK